MRLYIGYADSDEEGQILIHLGQKQYQMSKQRVTVMIGGNAKTTQLHTHPNAIPPLQGNHLPSGSILREHALVACRAVLHSHSYKLGQAAPAFEE